MFEAKSRNLVRRYVTMYISESSSVESRTTTAVRGSWLEVGYRASPVASWKVNLSHVGDHNNNKTIIREGDIKIAISIYGGKILPFSRIYTTDHKTINS